MRKIAQIFVCFSESPNLTSKNSDFTLTPHDYLYLPCCLIWHIEVSDFLTISLVQVHEDCFCCSGGCSPSCVTSGPSCVTSGGSGFLAVTGTGNACSFFKDSRGPVSTMSFSLKVGKFHKVFFLNLASSSKRRTKSLNVA